MTDILVPILDADDVEWAVNQVIAINRQRPVVAHLLAVRHPLPMHITRFFCAADLQGFHRDAGLNALAPAIRLLEQAGIRYETHVVVGRKAQSIVKLAKQLGDVQIVLPEEHQGFRSSFGMGSIGSQVEQLMHAPSA